VSERPDVLAVQQLRAAERKTAVAGANGRRPIDTNEETPSKRHQLRDVRDANQGYGVSRCDLLGLGIAIELTINPGPVFGGALGQIIG